MKWKIVVRDRVKHVLLLLFLTSLNKIVKEWISWHDSIVGWASQRFAIVAMLPKDHFVQISIPVERVVF